LVLLPLTLFAVFYVSAPSIALVETTVAHRAEFDRVISPDRVAQVTRATATPARKGRSSAAERRRDERERGLAALVTRLLTVSLAGLPFLPGLKVDTAFLVAVLIGTGAPLLMMCSILFVRRMIAWRTVLPFMPAFECATNGEEAAYTAQILRPRIKSRAQAFGYHDPLGTPLLGTPGGVARLAMGSLVALSLYTSVLAYMAWRGTTLSPVPLAASVALTAAAIVAAWVYVLRQPPGVRILAADTDADAGLV
jgi:hypothetical protein